MIGKRITEKLIIPLGGGPPSCDLLDSYSEEEYNNNGWLNDVHPSETLESAVGQSFQMGGSNKKICKAKFYLKKSGSPVGNMKAVLYAHTGTFGEDGIPTGSILASSDSVAMASIGTDYALVEFTFTGGEKYEMQANTVYVIQIIAYDATTLNETDHIWVAVDTAGTHNGNCSYYDEGSWQTYYPADVDTCFYVYGEAV